MMRLVQVQGPIESLDAVVDIGREGLLDFQDYYRDEHFTYSAMLVIFDDREHAECEVVDQLRTLLLEKGVDPATFRVTDRFLCFPDALEGEWYERMHTEFGQPLLALEALGVRTKVQQHELERLREEITYRVAGASERAEAHIEDFLTRINNLLGLPPGKESNSL